VSLHVFVDESRRGSMYLLAAAMLQPAYLSRTRSLMRGLRVPGERKLHFKSERDTIKKDIAAAIVAAGIPVRIYVGHGQADAVRERGLQVAVYDLVAVGLQRLVMDARWHDGNQSDRRVIHAALLRTDTRPETVSYEHLSSHEEPALWIADAVAWCYGAGGEWRRRVDSIVETVTDMGRVDRRQKRR
jgi:hypothetical protein